jgi:hypothetical protein
MSTYNKSTESEDLMYRMLPVKLHPKLHERIGREAEKANMPMTEFVSRLVADALGCPDLGVVQRKWPGRKRLELTTR